MTTTAPEGGEDTALVVVGGAGRRERPALRRVKWMVEIALPTQRTPIILTLPFRIKEETVSSHM